jgi:outer membrane protein assembly factor BamB
VTSRGEVRCLDTEGFHDGEDDGPEKAGLARIFDLRKSEDPAADKVAPAIAELNHGKLPAALREGCAGRGVEFPDEVDITIDEEGKHWTVVAKIGEARRHFTLMIAGTRLSVFKQVTPEDRNEADVVWKFDMMKELGVSQHNLATCGPTIWGDVLFICTSNGLDESHINLPAPEAPSFMAMNKNTGEVLWTDNSPGENILHGQWSCPVVGVFKGVPQVMFPGGDGWLYSFRADRWKHGKPELLWKFDANPKESKWILGGRGTRNNLVAVPVIYDRLVYVVVGQDPEHGEGDGHLWCIDPTRRGDVSPELVVDADGERVPHRRLQAAAEWERIRYSGAPVWDGLDEGKVSESLRGEFLRGGVALPKGYGLETVIAGRQWIITTNIGGVEEQFKVRGYTYRNRDQQRHSMTIERRTSETVKPNPNSAVVWHYDKFDFDGDGEFDFYEEMHRSIGSPTIKNDLLVISDFSGLVHCLNAKTGIPHWTCDLLAACWGTPLIVEDKVYVGDEDGDVAIFDLTPDPSNFTQEDPDGLVPLHEINMDNSLCTTPIVVNNVLYIANRTHLFAIEESVKPRAADAE